MSLDQELNHISAFSYSSILRMGVTKMPFLGPSVNGECTASGICPGDSLKSNLQQETDHQMEHVRGTAIYASVTTSGCVTMLKGFSGQSTTNVPGTW